MAQRTWLVRPDHQIGTVVETPEGYVEGQPVGVVSQESLLKAVMDGAIVLDRCGGTLAVSLERRPTGVPGERVTAGAMVTWKDRTDARAAPEQDGPSIVPPVERPESTEEFEPVVGGDGVVRHAEEGAVPVGVSASGEEVDESDVPLELRG